MSGRIVPRNIADLYRCAAETYGDAPAFARRRSDGSFEPTSYRALYETGLDLATALIDAGVQPREHVAIFSDNRLEWILTDCAIQLAGAADVPRASDVTEAEIRYILQHADIRVVFVEDLEVLTKLNRSGVRDLDLVVTFEGGGAMAIAELVERGRALRRAGDRRAEERMGAIQPDDLFTLIYTSGTTGTPKGVQLTHANMVSQVENLPFELRRGDRALSILPVWHSYERVFEMVAISWGVCTYYTSIRTIVDDLRTVRPTVMASAPRLWENLYTKILAKVECGPPWRRACFRLAYAVARRVGRARRFFRGDELDLTGRTPLDVLAGSIRHGIALAALAVPHAILDRMVLAKVRHVVGGEFRGTISGGGALQPHVDEFFNAIGIPVLEGYGLTETSPVVAVRTWKRLVLGTVGRPFPNTRVRIVDLDTGEVLFPNRRHRGMGRGLRGEICVRGPQVMKGYYKDPEGTGRVLEDGWLRTGDIGIMTFNDCLRIVGRAKDTIVLLGGENVEPHPIECRLAASAYIAGCMVVGQDRKFLGALIVPSLEAFRNAGIAADEASQLSAHSMVRTLLDADIRRLVSAEAGFKPFERIVAWRLVPKAFEIGDELTSTLKLKRHVIAARYAALIDEMYA